MSVDARRLLAESFEEPPLRAGTYHDKSMKTAMQHGMDVSRLEYQITLLATIVQQDAERPTQRLTRVLDRLLKQLNPKRWTCDGCGKSVRAPQARRVRIDPIDAKDGLERWCVCHAGCERLTFRKFEKGHGEPATSDGLL